MSITILEYTKIIQIIKKKECLTALLKRHNELIEEHFKLNQQLYSVKLAMDLKIVYKHYPKQCYNIIDMVKETRYLFIMNDE
jgi:hypothetical protein